MPPSPVKSRQSRNQIGQPAPQIKKKVKFYMENTAVEERKVDSKEISVRYEGDKVIVTGEVAGRKMEFESGSPGQTGQRCSGMPLRRHNAFVHRHISNRTREGIDYFPLMVDFEEKMYAAGKIPGGFFKREGRPSEKAIISARQIDRPLRPSSRGDAPRRAGSLHCALGGPGERPPT